MHSNSKSNHYNDQKQELKKIEVIYIKNIELLHGIECEIVFMILRAHLRHKRIYIHNLQ